jgi:hypothetical protein
LVSPAWWTYLWINEGFATLYEFFMPQRVYPEERFMDMFQVEYFHIALEFDANPNIRAMSHYVENPDRIERFAYKLSNIYYYFTSFHFLVFLISFHTTNREVFFTCSKMHLDLKRGEKD